MDRSTEDLKIGVFKTKKSKMECDYGVKDEYQAIESRRGWQPLFTEIREKSAFFSMIESKKITNRDLNRYRDVNPYDHSRIILKRGTCSYINASLVKVEAVERAYILTQGPLPTTVSHFWAMVWEQNCKIIAMLNNTIEKNQVKCHTYWPETTAQSSVLDDVQLTVELVEEDPKPNYVLRSFRLTDNNNGDVRLVKQYHYTTWPDFGVPATPSDFIQYLQDIRDTGGLGPGTEEDPVGPAVVHCSAGIGRSGTFCIVDTALLQLERGERVNVKELLLEMRRHRMGLIQTAEQLRFSYQSIIKGAESMNIDLRWVPPPESGSASCTDSDSDSSDSDNESDNPEEVEEEDDVASPGTLMFRQSSRMPLPEEIESIYTTSSVNDSEECPPPIPPRAESLSNPDYDRPLPLLPSKRPREEVEASTASETEEDLAEGDSSVVEEASSSECERKRRKQTEEIIPRAAESDNDGVRQRRQERKEKSLKTQQIINSIREKQKEQEKSSELQGKTAKTGSKWLGISVGIFILACVGFRYFQG